MQRHERDREGFIYFLRAVESRRVKIGFAGDIASRLNGSQVFSPELLELAASAPGWYSDEKTLHCRFGESRLHGEWFAESAELTALMNELQSAGTSASQGSVLRRFLRTCKRVPTHVYPPYIVVYPPKQDPGFRAEVAAAAKASGMSISAWLLSVVKRRLEREEAEVSGCTTS